MFDSYILIGFTYLLVKHFIFDFPSSIQTPWMFLNKGTYLHPGGVVHAMIHSLATLPLLILFSTTFDYYPITDLLRVVFCFTGEFLIHYHMDWWKVWWCKRKNYTPQTPEFWTWLGIDQLVHGLTYVWVLYTITLFGGF